MTGYLQAALRSLPAASARTSGASTPPRIERLSLELFGNLDRDGEPDMAGEQSVPPRPAAGPRGRADSQGAAVAPSTFNSFAAASAYDESLRPERVPPEARKPEEPSDVARGHAIYARTAGRGGGEMRRYPGSILDYRF